jgi:ribosomal protein S18 acetylase RimI-like enzyme
MTELDLRAAEIADLPVVCALIQSAYRGDASRTGWTTEADLLDGQRTEPKLLAAILADPDSVLMLGLKPDLVGCFQLERRPGGLAYFGTFAIRPNLQAAGLGRLLLAAAEAIAVQRWQSTTIEMTVIAQRAELIAWYERRGYERTGEKRDFPYRDERFGTPKRDDIYFEVLRKSL